MSDEKFLYGICVNVTIRSEREGEDDNDLTFFDNMTTHVKKFQATQIYLMP